MRRTPMRPIKFAGAEPVRCALHDVDGDYDKDFVCHFKTQEMTELDDNSAQAKLTGETNSSVPITGINSARIVPPKK